MRQKKVLPKIPSKLIEIALKDMKAVLAAGDSIDMGSWGEKSLEDDTCSFCMAGAVMRQTTLSKKINPNHYGTEGSNEAQYSFLDEIRRGAIADAMNRLGIEEPDSMKGMLHAFPYRIKGWMTYGDSSEKFFEQCEELITQGVKLGRR
jgi:hypothetical protein